MPRTRSLAFAELKLGILALSAAFLAAVLIFAVGGGGFFWQQYPLKTTFPNVAGIKSGSPVRIAGIEKGTVNKVDFAGTGVEVWIEVENDVRPLVTTASIATIGSISLLGEGAVDITPAPEGTPLPNWGYVKSGTAAGSIAELTESATGGLEEAKRLIQDLRAGKGTVGKLFTDDAVYREIEGFVRAAERVTTAVADGKGTLGKLTQDPKLYDELERSIANLNTITLKLRNGEGTLGQLMNDPALANESHHHHEEPRIDQRSAEQRRGHDGQAPQRRCALQASGWVDHPPRHAGGSPQRRPGYRRPVAAG